jgi:muconolactone delta-isomerase
MKFLVVTVGRFPVPPEAALGLMEAMKGWVERYDGKMDALWGFAGMPGGCGIVNVDTADELDEIMTSFPFAQLSEIQIYPLADLRKSLDRATEAFQAMAAGM